MRGRKRFYWIAQLNDEIIAMKYKLNKTLNYY